MMGFETGPGACLCVIVPCHNEEDSLPSFLAAVCEVEASLAGWLAAPVRFVFINDGSTDGTLGLLRHFHEEDGNVHYVSFSRNFGKEAGMYAGLKKALSMPEVTHVTFMDADLQDPPALLSEMFARVEESGCDVVAAFRKTRAGESPVRSAFARAFYRLINRISEVEMRDGARDFRLMTRRAAQAVLDVPERSRFSKGLFSWVGFETEWVGYENVEREHGSTNWSFWSLVRYALDGIIAFSTAPLEFISIAGLVVFLLSVVFLVFVVVRALLFGDPVAGWPSLVCIITLLSGLQLLSLGFVGLYVSKVYTEAKGRPLYVVSEEE